MGTKFKLSLYLPGASIDGTGRISLFSITMFIQGPIMKVVAVVLLLALTMVSGCGGSNTRTVATAQLAASGGWSAQLLGGAGEASGLSFTTQFTVNGDGSLSVTFFQFLTEGLCFTATGEAPTGTMDLTLDNANQQVTGTFAFAVQSSGDTLTLNGTVTGTETGTALTGGTVTGTWTLAGGSGACAGSSGTFTMTETSGTT